MAPALENPAKPLYSCIGVYRSSAPGPPEKSNLIGHFFVKNPPRQNKQTTQPKPKPSQAKNKQTNTHTHQTNKQKKPLPCQDEVYTPFSGSQVPFWPSPNSSPRPCSHLYMHSHPAFFEALEAQVLSACNACCPQPPFPLQTPMQTSNRSFKTSPSPPPEDCGLGSLRLEGSGLCPKPGPQVLQQDRFGLREAPGPGWAGCGEAKQGRVGDSRTDQGEAGGLRRFSLGSKAVETVSGSAPRNGGGRRWGRGLGQVRCAARPALPRPRLACGARGCLDPVRRAAAAVRSAWVSDPEQAGDAPFPGDRPVEGAFRSCRPGCCVPGLALAQTHRPSPWFRGVTATDCGSAFSR